MDPRPSPGPRSRRMLVAIVAILGAGVLVGAGLLATAAPASRPNPVATGSPSSAIAQATPSASLGSSPSSTDSAGSSVSADPTASVGAVGSAEPTAWDSGLLSADPTASDLATSSTGATPTAARTPTPRPDTPAPPSVTPTIFHPATAILAKPNLAYAFHAGVPNPICGLPYTVSATIVNSGQAPSVNTNLYLLDQYPVEHTLSTAYTGVPALDVGETATVSVTFTASISCGQTHRLVLRIDAASNNDETNETDNYLRIDYDIRGPNLYPSDLTVLAHPACGSVTVGVRVNNNGNAQGSSGLVRFTDTYAGTPSYSKIVYVSYPNIAPGTSRIVSQTFPALAYCNRTHTLTAFVDSGGTVPERNESDNSMRVTYHPDL